MGFISLDGPVVRSTVSVSIPSELKQQALRYRIPFSATLEQALVARIEDLERAAGGNQCPRPGHHPRSEEANTC